MLFLGRETLAWDQKQGPGTWSLGTVETGVPGSAARPATCLESAPFWRVSSPKFAAHRLVLGRVGGPFPERGNSSLLSPQPAPPPSPPPRASSGPPPLPSPLVHCEDRRGRDPRGALFFTAKREGCVEVRAPPRQLRAWRGAGLRRRRRPGESRAGLTPAGPR